jgi:hypothetical protein
VLLEDGRLKVMADLPGQPPLELGAISETEFFYRALDARLTFQLHEDDRVIGMVGRHQGRDLPAARVDQA